MIKTNMPQVLRLRTDKGFSAIHFAASLDADEAVHRLILAGMSPNTLGDKDQSTPLMFAASNNATDTVRRLLSDGANPNLKTGNGSTALHFLSRAKNADPEIVKHLAVNRGAKANLNAADNQGNTPLHVAVSYDNIAIIKALIAHKANPETANKEGKKPYQLAKTDQARAFFKPQKEDIRKPKTLADLITYVQNHPDSIKYPDSSIYNGEMKNGVKHGLGILISHNREGYQGDWVNDKREGAGTYYYANENSYAGAWRNNVPHGRGVFAFANNGGAIQGTWKNGAFIEGYGTFTGTDGTVYSGTWADRKLITYSPSRR